MNSEDKCLALNNKIEVCGCSIICAQETKKQHFDHSFIRKFSPRRFDKFEYVPSCGASGGLLVIWCSALFTGTTIHKEWFALTISLSSTKSHHTFHLTNIYGPCSGEGRTDFVYWLENLNVQPDTLWLLLGDLNFIRSTENRNRGGGNIDYMMKFNEIISNQALVELPLKGRMYTWSNMQEQPLLEQLDWFFTSIEWSTVFPNTLVKPLAKPVSDHMPCVVMIETHIPRSRMFRFENFWPLHPGFQDTVQSSWRKPIHAANNAQVIAAKFKRLRCDLKH
jgi:mannosylglycoprotein endo-beta-mannosidase